MRFRAGALADGVMVLGGVADEFALRAAEHAVAVKVQCPAVDAVIPAGGSGPAGRPVTMR